MDTLLHSGLLLIPPKAGFPEVFVVVEFYSDGKVESYYKNGDRLATAQLVGDKIVIPGDTKEYETLQDALGVIHRRKALVQSYKNNLNGKPKN
jgi:hypothetical protein